MEDHGFIHLCMEGPALWGNFSVDWGLCSGGCQDQLVKNKRGKIVSLARHEQGKQA